MSASSECCVLSGRVLCVGLPSAVCLSVIVQTRQREEPRGCKAMKKTACVSQQSLELLRSPSIWDGEPSHVQELRTARTSLQRPSRTHTRYCLRVDVIWTFSHNLHLQPTNTYDIRSRRTMEFVIRSRSSS